LPDQFCSAFCSSRIPPFSPFFQFNCLYIIYSNSSGTWLRNEICGPLEADVYLGLTEKEAGRVRNLVAFSKYRALAHSLLPKSLGSEVGGVVKRVRQFS
jgi:hypothetical protein